MSNIISIHFILEFLIFIYIIPIYITIETEIKIAFLNGFNVIRCSDKQVQVYQSNDDTKLYLSNTLKCDNKNDILIKDYAGFKWNDLKIICSSNDNEVHEEQFITKAINSNKVIHQFPDVQGQLGQSKTPYELQVENNDDDDDDTIKISSTNQPANNAYFNKNTNPKERRIYIWISDHPIICRLKFTGEEDNPCPSMNDQVVENVDYACYYNPGSEEAPTVEEMEAELKQVQDADKPENSDAYVLDIEKPVCI